MSSKVIIELNKEVAEELMDREYKAIDYDHVPFAKFTLVFPATMYFSKHQMMRDIENDLGRKLEPFKDHKALEYMDSYLKSNISVHIKIDEIGLSVSIVDSAKHQLFKYDTRRFLPLPLVEVNTFSRNALTTAMMMTRMIGNVIDYITSPTVIVRATESREVKKPSNKKSKKKKSSQKTYIYKTTYKIDHISDEYHPKREYTRQTESWGVKGFWRHYKNGKKVWIKEHNRGKGKETPKEMKITRLDN